MSPESIQTLLWAMLLSVTGLLAANLILIVGVRTARGIHELSTRRVKRRAAWPLAAFLDGELDLEAARARLEPLRRAPLATLLREHALLVAGETRERLEDLYHALGFGDEDRRDLRSRRWHVQLRAARVYGRFTFRGALDPLERLLEHERESLRLAAARALGRVGTPEAVARVLTLVGRTSAFGLIELVSILGEIGEPALGPLRTVLFEARDPRARADGAEIAGQIRAPALLPVLFAYAEDEDVEVLTRTARALGHFPDPGTPAVLRRLLRHPDWPVRAQAAKSLGRLADPASAEDLARALRDPSWWVRLDAAVALRRLGAVGEGRLRRVSHGADRYAAEMARRVLRVPVDRSAA